MTFYLPWVYLYRCCSVAFLLLFFVLCSLPLFVALDLYSWLECLHKRDYFPDLENVSIR